MRPRIAIGFLVLALGLLPEASAKPARRAAPAKRPFIAEAQSEHTVHSNAPLSFKAAGLDTFCIYGGPGSELGKFQVGFDGPGLTRDSQGWTPVDATEIEPLWQPSTFNSPTGTTAMWAGQSAEQQSGWATPPGYGNAWNALLTYRHTVSEPSVGQTVQLGFTFNHDTEPLFDFFDVEYDSASTTRRILRLDGSNKDGGGNFTPVAFPTGAEIRTIQYAGNDYSGPGADEIVIRLAVRSDGAWSDEDGSWPSDGAAQVDEISVTHADGVDFEDFEGDPSSFRWEPEQAPFAGNYGDIYERLSDIDPCVENLSPLIGFIDHPNPYFGGTPGAGGSAEYLPRNPSYTESPTDGTLSPTWNYGIPGGWVVSYTGGISYGGLSLSNEWWSPEIAWDLPTTADDGPEYYGARLRFSLWGHLPIAYARAAQWQVRAKDSSGEWSAWENDNTVFGSSSPRWQFFDLDITGALPPDRDSVQVRLSLRELMIFWPGLNSTPAPCFDNVTLLKYAVGGPNISANTANLFQDSFSQSGASNLPFNSTPSERDAFDIRLDMARDVNSGANAPNTPGDSIVVDVVSVLPGVAISNPETQIRMHYSLNMNPTFEAAIRGNAPVTESGTGLYGWEQHEGTVNAAQAYSSAGAPEEHQYFFDLPDVDFMYPGDVLEYYIEAFDDDGNTTTLPKDLTGYDDEGDPSTARYDRRFTVRALPSYSLYGSTPDILVWNDSSSEDGPVVEALLNDNFSEGGPWAGPFSFDSYVTRAPTSAISNGLGSAGAHGATPEQLRSYPIILADFGDLSSNLLSNGDAQSYSNDKSDDIGALTGWWNDAVFSRGIAHFGDDLAADLFYNKGSSGITYMATVMGISFVEDDVRPTIDNQTTPGVEPSGLAYPYFGSQLTVLGDCPDINDFDFIRAQPWAIRTHGFSVLGNPGAIYANAAAGVMYEQITKLGVHRSTTFPFGFASIAPQDLQEDPPTQPANILCETLYSVGWNPPIPKSGQPCGIGSGTEPDPETPTRSLNVAAAQPNPFNPSTRIAFTLGRDAKGSIRIYNVRGELVRRLADGNFGSGLNELVWHGDDDRGTRVASGVYIVRYEIDGFSKRQKVAMVK